MLSPRMMTMAGIVKLQPSGFSPSQRRASGFRAGWDAGGWTTAARSWTITCSARRQGGGALAHRVLQGALGGALVQQHPNDGLPQGLRYPRVDRDGGTGARVAQRLGEDVEADGAPRMLLPVCGAGGAAPERQATGLARPPDVLGALGQEGQELDRGLDLRRSVVEDGPRVGSGDGHPLAAEAGQRDDPVVGVVLDEVRQLPGSGGHHAHLVVVEDLVHRLAARLGVGVHGAVLAELVDGLQRPQAAVPVEADLLTRGVDDVTAEVPDHRVDAPYAVLAAVGRPAGPEDALAGVGQPLRGRDVLVPGPVAGRKGNAGVLEDLLVVGHAQVVDQGREAAGLSVDRHGGAG